MNILYVAKHGCGDNDDEGAIGWSLEQLGHRVHRINESKASKELRYIHVKDYDVCLFHKWEDYAAIASMPIPRVFWYFDLIDFKDADQLHRSKFRMDWMGKVLPHCAVGFCTDGDWVQRHPGKLVHLLQGADERVAGYGINVDACPPILFTGARGHGLRRAEQLAQLQSVYGSRFLVLGDGGPHTRKHGRALADVFAATSIVIAPDTPTTDRYWSNRVYLTTSLGGFLLHPYCALLAEQYEPGKDLVFYHNRAELLSLIDHYLLNPKEREAMRAAGYRKTLSHHTYKLRCQILISTIQNRLGIQ